MPANDGLTREQWQALPKAKLFWLRRRSTFTLSLGRRSIRWAKFRNANAMFVWLGPLEIGWRMPWLNRSARQLYPHLFRTGAHHD
jgi:hypothetical protein